MDMFFSIKPISLPFARSVLFISKYMCLICLADKRPARGQIFRHLSTVYRISFKATVPM